MTAHRRNAKLRRLAIADTALAAVCGLSLTFAPTSIAAGTEEATAGPCTPAGSKTLRADAQARVYLTGSAPPRAFGCMFATGKSFFLAPTSLAADGAPINPRTIALSSPWVAYSVSEQGSAFGEVYVVLKNLRTGKAKRKADAGLDQLGPEKSSAVTDIVASAAGAVAWIATGSAEGPPRQAREVVAIGSTGVRQTLDAAADVDPRSLVLRRHRLSWTDGGVRQSAVLR